MALRLTMFSLKKVPAAAAVPAATATTTTTILLKIDKVNYIELPIAFSVSRDRKLNYISMACLLRYNYTKSTGIVELGYC